MLYNTEAIVVRSIAYGETNAIVTLLTPSGLVAAMARGAKKPQSRFAAGVQQCVEGMYTLYRKSGMGTLSQVEITNAHRFLREDLQRAAYAAYFCELALSVAEAAPDGSAGLYRSFVGALARLEAADASPVMTARIWEAKVLRALGASPDWTNCVRCQSEIIHIGAYSTREGGFLCATCAEQTLLHKGSSQTLRMVSPVVPKVLKSFESVPWERLGQVTLNPGTVDGLKQVLEVQLRDFAGVSPKSRGFLDSIDEVYGDDTNSSN